ncbi:MAG TPA: hypothetical protein VHZ74_18550 [Bryobacteraceae bacterium]|nr:hypothetical protein [Bryobacteraceae bacterium]
MKKRMYAEYGVDPRRHVPAGLDHFIPLWAGGSSDLTNLRFQPETNLWNGRNYGYHEKDDLEVWICEINIFDPMALRGRRCHGRAS